MDSNIVTYEPKGLDFHVQNNHSNKTEANITVTQVTLSFEPFSITNFGPKRFNDSINFDINSNLKKAKLGLMVTDNSYDVFGTSRVGHGRI